MTTLPEWPSNMRKKGKNVHPDGKVYHHTCIGEIRHQQSTDPNKVIYLQQIQFEDGHTELRLCYYIIGKKEGRMKGKWVFGQFATFLPAEDFKAIVEEAQKRKWI